MDRKHPLAKCENCPLSTTGRYLPSEGPAKASLAIVSDAPSRTDYRAGKHGTGPGGKLVDLLLQHNDIDKEEVFFTNATLCRPPDYSAPPKSAIIACNDRLVHELQEHEVEKVVALGNSAAEALLGQSKVTQLRVGPPKPALYDSAVQVIPTIHPAACLRSADQFPDVVADFRKVNHAVRTYTKPTYVVSGDQYSAIELLDAIDARYGNRPVVIDIEVDIDKDTAFGHPNQYGMLCVGIGYAKGKAVIISEDCMAQRSVRDRLSVFLDSHPIIAQNGKFDIAGLYPVVGAKRLWFDIMLASYVFDERGGVHSLEYLAMEFLGAPSWKHEIAKYVDAKHGYGNVPRPILYKYNASDVVNSWDLYEMYLEWFETEPELRALHDFLVQASDPLMYIELNGFTVDRDRLRELDIEYKQLLTENRRKLDALVTKNYDKYGGLNPNSPLQVKKALADYNITVSGTDEKILTQVKEALEKRKCEGTDAYKFIDIILNNRTLAKAHGTYVKGIESRLYRGRIYSSYLLHGTTTGRLSSRNPNMQNIPRGPRLRSMFKVSKPENILMQSDYKQAELRILTWLAKDEYFREIFNDPTRDLFDELTPILYGVTKDQMSAADWKELRIRVKAYVYGLGYGREAASIAAEFKMPIAEAVKGMNLFFEVIPDIVAFRDQTMNKVLAGDDLVTPFGRHRRYGLITKENKKTIMNEALAFLPQSTASDVCLRALITMRPALRGLAYVRNTIHDAIIVECHEDDKIEVAEIMREHMLQSARELVGDYVLFDVDCTTGKNWGEL